MKEIINWLRDVELFAFDVYSLAAKSHAEDQVLSDFLVHNAEEEAWHFHVMGSAVLHVKEHGIDPPAIEVDHYTQEKIFGKLRDIKSGAKVGISREELLRKIVDLEISEWNDIFLYIVNTLKQNSPAFEVTVKRIQNHLNELEQFVEEQFPNNYILAEVRAIPSIWQERILIVDDEPLVSGLIRSLLNRDADIDIASNGREALEKIENNSYKLIISDIDMPIMDGMTLYKEVRSKYPETAKRFLFHTGGIDHERQSFFEQEGVTWLPKPISVNILQKTARLILEMK